MACAAQAQAGERVASGIDRQNRPSGPQPLWRNQNAHAGDDGGDLDVVLVDLQDVGTRFYTYSTTLLFMLRAAEKSGAEVIIVLDRPNPQGGVLVEGPVLEPPFRFICRQLCDAGAPRHDAGRSCAKMFVSEEKAADKAAK
jgi:uncharacterized protein YbbC (DUF1343 family)